MKHPVMKACPFCGTTEEGGWIKLCINHFTVWVECTQCETTGPEVSLYELAQGLAAKAWNKRKE